MPGSRLQFLQQCSWCGQVTSEKGQGKLVFQENEINARSMRAITSSLPRTSKQVVEARAAGIAGGGEAGRVDEHAGFYAEASAPDFARRKPGASGSP